MKQFTLILLHSPPTVCGCNASTCQHHSSLGMSLFRIGCADDTLFPAPKHATSLSLPTVVACDLHTATGQLLIRRGAAVALFRNSWASRSPLSFYCPHAFVQNGIYYAPCGTPVPGQRPTVDSLPTTVIIHHPSPYRSSRVFRCSNVPRWTPRLDSSRLRSRIFLWA